LFARSGLWAFLLAPPWTPGASAQEGPPLGFAAVAEVTFVMTSGNATSTTLGVKNTATYRWPESSVQLAVGAVRAESGVTTRVATGTPDDFTVTKQTVTETSAESYFARTRYDRALSTAAFLFGGAGWDRNTFAGIQNRYAVVAGAGRSWYDREDRRFKADVGMTYTVQEDVESSGATDSFLGARASIDFFRAVTASADLTSVLVIDENLDETSDVRADWTNSLTVAVSESLALKASVQVLFDNQPSLVGVPLGDDRVLVPLEKTDGSLSLALVVNF
jgi:putative salt-induced outer membrane protein YdiY